MVWNVYLMVWRKLLAKARREIGESPKRTVALLWGVTIFSGGCTPAINFRDKCYGPLKITNSSVQAFSKDKVSMVWNMNLGSTQQKRDGRLVASRTWLLWKSGMQRINTLYSKKNDVSRTGEQFKHGVLSSLKAGQRKCKAEVMTKYPRKKVSIFTIVIYQIFQRSKLFVKIWKWFE